MAKRLHSEMEVSIKQEIDPDDLPYTMGSGENITPWQNLVHSVIRTQEEHSSFLLRALVEEITFLMRQFVTLIGKTCALLPDKSDNEKVELESYPLIESVLQVEPNWYMYVVDQEQFEVDVPNEMSTASRQQVSLDNSVRIKQEEDCEEDTWQFLIREVMRVHEEQDSFLLRVLTDEVSRVLREFVTLIGKTCVLLPERASSLDKEEERIDLESYPIVKSVFQADDDWYIYVVDHVEFEFDLHNAVTDNSCQDPKVMKGDFQNSGVNKRSDSTDSETNSNNPLAGNPLENNLSDSCSASEDNYAPLTQSSRLFRAAPRFGQNKKGSRIPPNADVREKLKTKRYRDLVARNQKDRPRPGRARDSSPTGFGEGAGMVTIPDRGKRGYQRMQYFPDWMHWSSRYLLTTEKHGHTFFKKRLTKHDVKCMADVLGYVICEQKDQKTAGDMPQVRGYLTYTLSDGETYHFPAPLVPIRCDEKEDVYALELQLGFQREYAFRENPQYKELFEIHYQKKRPLGVERS